MVALFRLFVLLFVNLMMREQALIPCLTSRFVVIELTFGSMPILTRRSRASTFQVVSTRLSPGLPLPLIPLFLDTLRPRVVDGSEGVAAFGFGFLCTIVTLMPESALVSLRTLAFFFPLIPSTFSSFNAA